MNINQVRTGLKTQISTVYKTGIGVTDTAAIVRGEVNQLLDDLRIIEQNLPPIDDSNYHQVANQFYRDAIDHWIARGGNIFKILEIIQASRFNSLKTPLQLWTRLHELAKKVDEDTTGGWTEFKLSMGIGKSKTWVARCEGMHPNKLAEYKQRNQETMLNDMQVKA